MTQLRRRFVQVGERRVHYLRAGEGPPVVLIHSSPANAWLLRAEIEHLRRDYTVFAPDTPGFGLSQPLPLAQIEIDDLADALADTLAAMDMPACPMFGTHTGAAIALAFGVRHPDRITGLVLDGVPAFTEAEIEAFFGDYFRDLPPTDLGGQYAEVWTRFRDQSIWFPWCERRPENLNAYDLGAPHSTHLWASMYFEAQETYEAAYRAASYWGQKALTAAAALRSPAIYTATDADMLFAHMARLPPMKAGQEIRHIGASYAAKRDLICEGFARFGSPDGAPADKDAVGGAHRVGRQFVDSADGRQIHLRHAGSRTAPPLLLVHDAPGSSAQWEALIEALGAHFFVLAPDLPGTGESDPLVQAQPDLVSYADALCTVLDEVGVGPAAVYGIGFGASVAAALARRAPRRVPALALRGVLLPDAAERQDLLEHYAPPIEIERDGAHWYRTWLMLRDSQVWWPWYDRRHRSLRRVSADFDAWRLHRWTVDVMRRRETYGHVIRAALSDDLAQLLSTAEHPVLRLVDPMIPLSVYDPAFADLRPSAPSLTVEHGVGDHARSLAKAFQRR